MKSGRQAARRPAGRSPAACLLPQMRERNASRRRFRLRRDSGGAMEDSPGAFYTYFSAGQLLFPEEERRRRRVAARSPRTAIALALCLAAAWTAARFFPEAFFLP